MQILTGHFMNAHRTIWNLFKTVTIPAVVAVFCTLASTAQAFPDWIGNCCDHPNQVTPTGTLYAGDDVTFVKMLNQSYVGLHCEVQISTTGNSGFSAAQMNYGGNDSNNSWWKYTLKFASGTVWFFHDGWDDFSGSHIYDSNDGANFSQTITALNNPTDQSVTQVFTSQIDLAWTRGISGVAKNTIILRNTTGIFIDPTQGTSYDLGASVGTGANEATVVYASGNETSFSDTGLSPSTTYYYKFYAENYGYYSSGVTANATTKALPVANTDTVTRTAGTNGTKVSVSTLLANDTDADGDTLTISSVSSTSQLGASVQLSGAWIFYTPSIAIISNDSFTYVLSDGFGGTATGTVNVNIAPDDNGQSQNLLSFSGGPGDFTINFAGILGRTYSIQWAPAVDGPWTTIGTATADSNTGLGTFHDSTNHGGTAFYRTAYP